MILGCHPGDCHYREGNHKALRRYHLLSKMLTELGIAAERFKLEWVSASEADKFIKVITDMETTLKSLGPINK